MQIVPVYQPRKLNSSDGNRPTTGRWQIGSRLGIIIGANLFTPWISGPRGRPSRKLLSQDRVVEQRIMTQIASFLLHGCCAKSGIFGDHAAVEKMDASIRTETTMPVLRFERLGRYICSLYQLAAYIYDSLCRKHRSLECRLDHTLLVHDKARQYTIVSIAFTSASHLHKDASAFIDDSGSVQQCKRHQAVGQSIRNLLAYRAT